MAAVATALTGSDQTITQSGATANRRWCGYAVKENAAAAASISFYDGTSVAGIYLGGAVLAANAKAQDIRAVNDGVILTSGSLFIKIESGTIVGSVLFNAS